MPTDNKKFLILFSIFLLAVICILFFRLHYYSTSKIDYIKINETFLNNAPETMDEWRSITLSNDLIDTEKINDIDQYSNYPESKKGWFYKYGLPIFLSDLGLLFNINLIDDFYLIYAIVLFLGLALLYLFMRKYTSFFPAVFAMIFFILTKTRPSHLLGNYYLIPIFFGSIFIFLYFHIAKEFHKNIPILLLILFSVFFIHPIISIILFLVFFIQLFNSNGFSKIKEILKEKSQVIFLSLISIIFLINIFFLFFKGSFLSTIILLIKSIFYSKAIAGYAPSLLVRETFFELLSYIGIPLILFGTYGVYSYLKKKQYDLFVPFVFLAIILIEFVLEFVFNVGILIQANRIINLLVIGLIPFAGIGLDELLKKIQLIKIFRKFNKKTVYLVFALLFIVLMSTEFINYNQKLKEDTNFASIMLSENDFQILSWIALNISSEKVIFTDKLFSVFIPPNTGNKVIRNYDLKFLNDFRFRNFEKFDCEEKKKILSNFDVDYVVNPCGEECPFFNKIYENGGRCIYGVEGSDFEYNMNTSWEPLGHFSDINSEKNILEISRNPKYPRKGYFGAALNLPSLEGRNKIKITFKSDSDLDQVLQIYLLGYSKDSKFLVKKSYTLNLNDEYQTSIISLGDFTDHSNHFFFSKTGEINKESKARIVLAVDDGYNQNFVQNLTISIKELEILK